jgi:hypothetical protein
MDEKFVIEQICGHADELIREGKYEDNVQQLRDFAAKHLGASLTANQLDKLVHEYMTKEVRDSRGGEVTGTVPYKDMEEYIRVRTVQIRAEQHSDFGQGKASTRDSSLSCDFRPTEHFSKKGY